MELFVRWSTRDAEPSGRDRRARVPRSRACSMRNPPNEGPLHASRARRSHAHAQGTPPHHPCRADKRGQAQPARPVHAVGKVRRAPTRYPTTPRRHSRGRSGGRSRLGPERGPLGRGSTRGSTRAALLTATPRRQPTEIAAPMRPETPAPRRPSKRQTSATLEYPQTRCPRTTRVACHLSPGLWPLM